ncbi:MAG: YbhB/YbcL family Raf kinase inhibitor-like protein [Candidatus Atribacteria bacterium]|nr:YbhB/YbcL family Raf kinase inhibitor-like protein [Candidatus Atribacteria bacterium]
MAGKRDRKFKKEDKIMKLESLEFENNGFIPGKFTCDGIDINPGLIIEDIPEDTKRLALIMEDPDAPMGTWVHWVVFNIHVTDVIEENTVPGTQGTNDFRKLEYGGPCPPTGTHRYFFKLYALDEKLHIEEGCKKKELEEAMEGHILATAELVGLYEREKNKE